jgi:hypothetical protein
MFRIVIHIMEMSFSKVFAAAYHRAFAGRRMFVAPAMRPLSRRFFAMEAGKNKELWHYDNNFTRGIYRAFSDDFIPLLLACFMVRRGRGCGGGLRSRPCAHHRH